MPVLSFPDRPPQGPDPPTITAFEPQHADAFSRLNREWLVSYDLLEPGDGPQLADPEAYFLGRGGQIFVAQMDGQVVGTAALLPAGPSAMELVKLAVDPALHGQGIGRSLVERCIRWARGKGMERIILVSNHRLLAAIALYESLGFEHHAPRGPSEYETADVYMELNL